MNWRLYLWGKADFKTNFLKFSTKTRIIKLIKGLCQYSQLLSLSSLFKKAAVLSA